MAELLVRIYHESQGKPIYVVKERSAAPSARPSRCASRAPAPRVDRASSSSPSRSIPVLGGGEPHIRELVAAPGRGRAAAPTVVTRRTDAAWPARGDARRRRACVRVGPSGAGRGGKYAMVPARAGRAAPRLRGATTCWWCAARACWACPASWRRALGEPPGRAAARGQRRAVGRGLHLGHGARPPGCRARSCRAAVARAQPAAARRRRLRGHVARDRATSSRRRACPPETVRHIPHGVDTRPLPPARRRRRGPRCARALGPARRTRRS